MARYIFVAGGVMSGIGKGIATASIGKILQSKGFRVTAVKIDPYVNVDAGTMNPIEHGEVFVTADGTECDQDVGNYERFIDEALNTFNYITTGRVYEAVIRRERNLEYGGKCVEVVPHIPEEVISRIKRAARTTKADFVLIEIGGTVGEYQNSLFLEAARMMRLDAPRKKKISVFCSVAKEDVISAPDVRSIYEVPLNFEKDKMGDRILKKFGLRTRNKGDLRDWKKLAQTIKALKKPVKIGIVGKYFETGKFTLMDSYISVIEAIKHACWFHKRKPEIHWLSSEEYEKTPRLLKELKEYDGIIVPGGFGSRGIEGKIKAIAFCRKNRIPYFGLCLGMQLLVIEFARHVCGLRKANSAEFAPHSRENVIDVMPDQDVLLKEKKYGGTMRLGEYKCRIKPNTLAFRAYKAPSILERHRHRYELNNAFRLTLEKRGMVMSGINPERDLVEIAELKGHPFFLGTQFHPEFKSRPTRPHPLFRDFIKAAIKK